MNLDFNQICRLCLRICENYVDLHQSNGVKSLSTELMEKIKFCYRIKIDLTDGLPTKVCYQCIQVISYFYVTKKNVISSQQLLKNVLHTRKKLEEDEIQMLERDEVVDEDEDVMDVSHNSQGNDTSSLTASDKLDKTNGSLDSGPANPHRFNISSKSHSNDRVVKERNKKVMEKNKELLELKKKRKHLKLSQDREQNLEDLLKDDNEKLELMLKFRDLKKSQMKSRDGQKQVEGVKVYPEEKIVKVIGTVIDESNILSPDVKRTRKSVLAS